MIPSRYLIYRIYFCRIDPPSLNICGAVRAFKGFNPERVERARGILLILSSQVEWSKRDYATCRENETL